jgi:ABC-type nickel/cobalt efflux system permease component RcnA
MTVRPEILLVGAVAAVGVLHTVVPDHWVPITLIARQRRWSKGETARAAAIAGTGHTISTLLIGLLVWIAGVAVATKFGHYVSLASSLALIGFGAWIAYSSWREIQAADGLDAHHDSTDDSVGTAASKRTALLLILGSSPMIEGIPAFFAAGKYGAKLLLAMALVFALATITTYVFLCVSSLAGLERINLGPLERYGEILSGAFIAVVGVVFLVFPIL